MKLKNRIFILGMFLIATFALSVGTASADLQVPDLVIPARDIVDISVEEHGSTLISNVECKIDFDGYFRDGPFDVYYLPPKNAENIVVKANNQLKTYHYLLNASEYINSNVKVPSEYIDDYTVIAWTVGDDFVPTRDDEYYMPINISVTYSHRLVGSILPGQAYTLKYALIPLGYKELNVTITLPVSTNPDTIICKPKQLQLSYNDSGTYLHLNENNSDYHVPFGDVEVCFSTHTASPIYVPDNPIYVPRDPIYVPDGFATIQDAVDAAYLNDTIIVRDGTYIENVDVYKRLTIRSENGSDSTIVHVAGEPYSVFNVRADYVNISGFTVKGEKVGWYTGGIYVGAEYCNISNNKCTNNNIGIYIGRRHGCSYNNCILNNICTNNTEYGIILRGCSDNNVSNNTCSNNEVGISIASGDNNSISNNKCTNNVYASIDILSSNNKLKGNVMVDNGISRSFGNEIDTSNTVNGKPVYYWANVNGGTVPDGAGQVILWNCSNVIVENQYLNNACIGIQIALSSNITVRNNTCSSNSKCGIFLLMDSNNNISITNNICIANNSHSNRYHCDGISLGGSDNNIANNTCSNNRDGIYLGYSNNNSITNNNCSNNDYAGIALYGSENNRISNNVCSNNDKGIYLGYSKNNKLTGNVMLENGIVIHDRTLYYTNEIDESYYTNEIDKSNTVNGKPVYYWKDIDGGRVPDGAGQVILVNCTNVIVENQNLNNASIGIQLAFSSSIIIKNNNCSNNQDYGIYLDDSENNSIYLNNFINNTDNIRPSYRSTNTWNTTSKITYTYHGSIYTNYLGNYWSDYTGNDTNSDGIGDTPYRIYSDKDIYPLMQPWENYLIEENGTNTKDENQKLAFSYYYQPINISVNASVPPYPLPMNLSTISNIEDITKLRLNETEEEL